MHAVSVPMNIFKGPILIDWSTSLSIVLRRKDVRLIGQNDLATSNDWHPGLGIKITLTLCHSSGIYPRTRQAVKILTSGSGPDKVSIPFFKNAGKISSSPADLKRPK
jgi:hypothetical protein